MKTSSTTPKVSVFHYGLLILKAKAVIILLTVALLLGLNPVSNAQQISGLDETIAQMLASGNPEMIEQGTNLQSLVYDLHSTVYIRNGELTNPLGGNPLVCNTDVASLWQLYEPNYLYEQVELILVMLTEPGDLAATLSLTNLQNFGSMKHLLFISKFPLCVDPNPACEVNVISQLISGSNEALGMILYKVSVSN